MRYFRNGQIQRYTSNTIRIIQQQWPKRTKTTAAKTCWELLSIHLIDPLNVRRLRLWYLYVCGAHCSKVQSKRLHTPTQQHVYKQVMAFKHCNSRLILCYFLLFVFLSVSLSRLLYISNNNSSVGRKTTRKLHVKMLLAAHFVEQLVYLCLAIVCVISQKCRREKL